MKVFVLSFSSSWMIPIFFLIFGSSSSETTQQWDVNDVSHHQTSVPCKGLKAIFPCRKLKASPSRETTLTPFSWNTITLFPSNATTIWDPRKIFRTTDPKTDITIDPFPWVFTPLPWNITLPPWLRKKTKSTFPNNKTVSSTTKRTRNPWSWEITRGPYPRDKDTNSNFDHKYNKNPPSDNIGVKILIVVGVAILSMLCFALKQCCRNGECDGSNSRRSGATLHSPPRPVMTISRNQGSAAPSGIHRNFTAPASNRTQFTSTNTPEFTIPSTTTATFPDKPPDYSTVVSDNFDKYKQFPEVYPANGRDIPPPPYEEKVFHS